MKHTIKILSVISCFLMISEIFSSDASPQFPKSLSLELPPLPASDDETSSDSKLITRLRAERDQSRSFAEKSLREIAALKAQLALTSSEAHDARKALRSVALNAAEEEPIHRRQFVMYGLQHTRDPEDLKNYTIGAKKMKSRRFCTWCCSSWYKKK